jgi:Clp amino terminal domain, pathogenicity island component
MGIFERYTEKARRTMHLAKCEADGFGSLEVGTEHILLALLRDSDLISSTMEEVSEPEIRAVITAYIPKHEPHPLPHDLPLSTDARIAVVVATEEADKLNQRYVMNEHVLLAVVQSENSYAAQLLKEKGVSTEKLRLHIKTLPQPNEAHNPTAELKESPPEVKLIRVVGELVRRSQGQKAVQLLDDFMAEPGQDRKRRMRLMGGFAFITALQLGDLNTARRYCEERLAYTPDDPRVLYELADVLARQDETTEARQRATECRRAAALLGSERGKAIIKLVEKRFPELKE